MEIRNSKLLDETEELETDTIYRTMRILNLTEGLRVTEAPMRLSADSDCNEQRAAAAGHGIIRMLAFLLLEYSEGETFLVIVSFTIPS